MAARDKVKRICKAKGLALEFGYSGRYYDIHIDAPAGRVLSSINEHGIHETTCTPPVSDCWDDALDSLGDGSTEPCPDFTMPTHIGEDDGEDGGCGDCFSRVMEDVAAGLEATAAAFRKAEV